MGEVLRTGWEISLNTSNNTRVSFKKEARGSEGRKICFERAVLDFERFAFGLSAQVDRHRRKRRKVIGKAYLHLPGDPG